MYLTLCVSAQNLTLNGRGVDEKLTHSKTDDRIRTYERLLAAAPRNQVYETGLISAYLQKLRESADFAYLDRAAKLVDGMFRRDPGNYMGMRFQNEIDMQRHDFKAVVERTQDMAKFEPSDPGNWGNLGDAFMELGEYEQAGNAYARMVALGANLGSYNRVAYFRFVTGDAEGAIALMKQAVDAGSDSPENTSWCWAELGDLYLKTGKYGEAAIAYKAALALFPTLHRAYAGLGRTYAAQDDNKRAIENYERAQSIVPMVEYAGALEDLYRAAGLKARAEQQSQMISAIEQLGRATGEKTNRNLALILADHDRDLDKALTLVETEIPTRGDVYTYDALSWVLFKMGRIEEARAASAKAMKLHTPEPRFFYHAGQIAKASGDETVARAYQQRVPLGPLI
jgi:tetratricopeptide (TPR) repeat protein